MLTLTSCFFDVPPPEWSASCDESRPIQRSLWVGWREVCQRCARNHRIRDVWSGRRFHFWIHTGIRHHSDGDICLWYAHDADSKLRQGVGGVVELAPGYLPAVYESIRKAGGLCIADEVQSGFARTGSHFWGFEAHGIVPDIVTMAKVNTLGNIILLIWRMQALRTVLRTLRIECLVPKTILLKSNCSCSLLQTPDNIS